ncbi:hypothetical protein [Fodinibius halophilus]|uniref:Porin n=1 Tax=Fodinibius halophilus TaxID=1736908 RepID=A0A6M1SWC4_9BACT|nr:hypothetical protein [Fodinibius halophilus]NGP87846.1 hypothetical protein [Fodinibius halophilus]
MVNRKISILTLIFVFLIGTKISFSQSNWEPETNITGYISTEVNYFDELDGYDLNYSAAVSEAGILISYQVKSNFRIKGVFVYRPKFEIDQMLNEAFGELTFSEEAKFKAGRFLLPLSPSNTYYYAPVNTSATLPILVTNHEFYPVTIDGASLNGSIGSEFKVNYDVFAGGFNNSTWLRTGAVRFFGDEVNYFKKQINSSATLDPSYNKTYNFGYGGRVGFSYKSNVDVGFSAFKPNDQDVPLLVNVPAGVVGPDPAQIVQESKFEKFSYGVNVKLQYNNTKLVGEYWYSDLKIDGSDTDLEGGFVELNHRINKVTPYIRYEDQKTADVDYKRYTAGINYKPSFRKTFKLEYLRYDHSSDPINGFVGTLIYSF